MPEAGTSARSADRKRLKGPDRSFQGVLIFSGIGLALMMSAIVVQSLDLPPPFF
jgi:hypothetical protein